MVLLGVVMMVPIEHPWHAALIAAVERLRSTGGLVVALEVGDRVPTPPAVQKSN